MKNINLKIDAERNFFNRKLQTHDLGQDKYTLDSG